MPVLFLSAVVNAHPSTLMLAVQCGGARLHQWVTWRLCASTWRPASSTWRVTHHQCVAFPVACTSTENYFFFKDRSFPTTHFYYLLCHYKVRTTLDTAIVCFFLYDSVQYGLITHAQLIYVSLTAYAAVDCRLRGIRTLTLADGLDSQGES